jgi:hypothetical protein
MSDYYDYYSLKFERMVKPFKTFKKKDTKNELYLIC